MFRRLYRYPRRTRPQFTTPATASDEGNLVAHHSNKTQRQHLAKRLKDPENSLELAIVCDMWLMGFDAPCLHTMYIDKPLKSHNRMQAIARINPVFCEKQGGLIVDYLRLAEELRQALAFYSQSGGQGTLTLVGGASPLENRDVAVGLLLAKLEVVEQIVSGFSYGHYFQATTGENLNILFGAANYAAAPAIKDRFLAEVTALSKVHSLAVPHPDAIAASELISFFQAIQASLRKLDGSNEGLSNREIETAICQVVDQALVSATVTNILAKITQRAKNVQPRFDIICYWSCQIPAKCSDLICIMMLYYYVNIYPS